MTMSLRDVDLPGREGSYMSGVVMLLLVLYMQSSPLKLVQVHIVVALGAVNQGSGNLLC